MSSVRIIPRLLAFPACAILGQVIWMSSGSPYSLIAIAIWVPVLSYCWFCVNGLSHELIHENLPVPTRFGRLMARLIGIPIWIPRRVYKEVHMRHHAYLNTPLDFELWPYSDPNASLRFRRAFVWFDVLLGYFATPMIWGRICFSRHSPASDEAKQEMRMEYAITGMAWLTAIAIGAWLHFSATFTFGWQQLVFALPILFAANMNSVRKMIEHVGTASLDPISGTRTIVGNGFLTRAYRYLSFELAVHGPHHRYPKLDHTELANRMDEIQQQRPDEDCLVFNSVTAALVHTVGSMWNNPAVGVRTETQATELPTNRRRKPRQAA